MNLHITAAQLTAIAQTIGNFAQSSEAGRIRGLQAYRVSPSCEYDGAIEVVYEYEHDNGRGGDELTHYATDGTVLESHDLG